MKLITREQKDIKHLAVSIREAEMVGICFLHSGIAYNKNGKIFYMDFAHQHIGDKLCKDDGKHLFTTPNILEDHLEYLAALCSKISRNKTTCKPMYSFQFDPDLYFDGDGNMVTTNGPGQFSCSTFVVAIFRSAQIPLVKHKTWPQKASSYDVEERKKVLKAWREHPSETLRGILANRADEIEPTIKTKRVSSIQVSAACLCTRLPVSYKRANRNARVIKRLLKKNRI